MNRAGAVRAVEHDAMTRTGPIVGRGEQRAAVALPLSWAPLLGMPEEYGAAVLTWLAGMGLRPVGNVLSGSVLLERGLEHGYDFWLLTDNGGELNIERVNDRDSMRSIPYTRWGTPINAVTLACRLRTATEGGLIDYNDLDRGFGLAEFP